MRPTCEHCVYPLNIRIPAATGATVGVRYRLAKAWLLATYVAYASHGYSWDLVVKAADRSFYCC